MEESAGMAPNNERAERRAHIAKSLTVVVPALNEERNLASTVERLLRALTTSIESFEIIIVNDGSTDRTGEIADRLGRELASIRVIHHATNMGLGAAYLSGIEAASKAYFVYIPGDNTWPYRSFLELFGNIGVADVVTSYSINPENRPFGRRVVSAAFTITMNALFGYRMRYYNGLTVYPIEFLRLQPISTFGFGFQAEALIKALALGLSYYEVGLPIDERTAGASKAVTLRNIVSVLGTIGRLFWDLRVSGHWRQSTGSLEMSRRSRSAASRSGTTVDEIGFRPAQPQPAAAAGARPATLSIVLSGGSSGVGAALVTALAGDGHRLFLCARGAVALAEVSRQGTIAATMPCDVRDERQVDAFADFVAAQTDRVDVLINCAGTFGEIGPIASTDCERWLDTIRVNLFGSYLMIRRFLPLLQRSPSARVLNFSGGGAFSPFPNYSAYACSKAALVRLTETLAAELADQGIAVNAVAPGVVATPMHETTLAAGPERAGLLNYRRACVIMKEGGAPIDTVVDCVRQLISPAFDGLTGKTISANFDPWMTPIFAEKIEDISRSDLFTLRRINIGNLPHGALRSILSKAWGNYKTQI